MTSPFHQRVQELQKEQSPFRKRSEERKQQGFFNFSPITEEMIQQVNPETLTQRGNAFARGGISGATLGVSEYIPGLELKGETGEGLGQFAGSVAPIGAALKAGKLAVKPLVNLAKKSPIAKKQMAGLANLLGVGIGGASYEGLEQAIKGEIPNPEKLATSGALWSVLDAGLSGLGKLGSFTKSLLFKAKQSGQTPISLLENITDSLKEFNLKTNSPERIAKKALSIIEEPFVEKVNPKKNFSMFTEEQLTKPIEQVLPPTGAGLIPAEAKKPAIQPKIERKIPFGSQLTTEKSLTSQNLTENIKNVSPVENIETNIFKKTTPEITKSELSLENRIGKTKNRLSPEENPLIRQNNLNKRIEKIATKPKTDLDFGERIQKDIKEQKSYSEAEYRPIYEAVRDVANTVHYTAQPVANQIVNILHRIQGFRFQPPGYGTTINQLTGFLEDLGYTLERNELGNIVNAHAPENPQTTIARLMDLGVRLNDAINYETLEKSVKDVLKPLVSTTKKEIRNGLASKSKLAEKQFSRAEELYAKTAQKFGKDSVNGILINSAPENIGKDLLKPSVLRDLKNILPIGRYEQIERTVLEHLNEMPGEKGQKIFQQIQEFISPNGRKLAHEIIQQKKFMDFAKQFINESGVIDFGKVKEALNNPKFLKTIEEIGGKEAVSFFRSLENMQKKIIENVETSKYFSNFLPSAGTQGQYQKGKARLIESVEKNKFEKSLEESLVKQKEANIREKIPSINEQRETGTKSIRAIGKSKLNEAAERIKNEEKNKRNIYTNVVKEKLPVRISEGEKAKGKEKLQKIANREKGLEKYVEKLEKTLGVKPDLKIALKVIFGLKAPVAGAGYILANILYNLSKKPSARKIFRRTANQKKTDPRNIITLVNEITKED